MNTRTPFRFADSFPGFFLNGSLTAMVILSMVMFNKSNFVAADATSPAATAPASGSPDQVAEELLKAAAESYADHKFLPARQALEKALALPGTSDGVKIRANIAMGKIAEAYSDWPNCKVYFSKALAFASVPIEHKTFAQQSLSKALMNLREFKEARTLLQDLVNNESLTAAARTATQILYAKNCYLQGSFEDARAAYAKALTMPALNNQMKAEIQLYIGLTYYDAHDDEHAKIELTKVLTMPEAGTRVPWDGGRLGYIPAREASLRLRMRNLASDETKSLKVLFVGSSHTARNDIPGIITRLAESAPKTQPRIIAGEFIRMGTTITTFWNAGETIDTSRGLIAAEPWDVVVFESTYNLRPEELTKYGTQYVQLIAGKKIKPVIYETPIAQANPYPTDYLSYHNNTLALAKSVNATVAPCLATWMKQFGQSPTQEQFKYLYADWIHATPIGSYINACSLYAAITGQSPVGLYHPTEISDQQAKVFQEMAWSVFCEANPDLK